MYYSLSNLHVMWEIDPWKPNECSHPSQEVFQSHLSTPMRCSSPRALTHLWTHSNKVSVSVTSWYPEDMQNMQWKHGGGCISLIACSIYKVIHKKYDDQLDKHDISSVILKYRCMHYFLLESKTPPFLRRSYMQDNMLIWSHRSNWLFY